MKKLFYLLCAAAVLLSACSKDDDDFTIPIDSTQAFPDPIFRAYVLEKIDTNHDGSISKEEALAVQNLIVYGSGKNDDEKIQSLEGVQYFTNLTYLRCEYNRLTTLDVSRNTALTELHCHDNQLTALDVSKNTALTYLGCTHNQLTALDVSQNTALTRLGCYSNQLTALDVSQNTALTDLSCYSNQLTDLDLSKTNLVNSEYNKDDSSWYPFDCAPMPTLKTLYLKKGWSIKYITADWDRSSGYIPDETEIVFVD